MEFGPFAAMELLEVECEAAVGAVELARFVAVELEDEGSEEECEEGVALLKAPPPTPPEDTI